jgi:hypothetical protein
MLVPLVHVKSQRNNRTPVTGTEYNPAAVAVVAMAPVVTFSASKATQLDPSTVPWNVTVAENVPVICTRTDAVWPVFITVPVAVADAPL